MGKIRPARWGRAGGLLARGEIWRNCKSEWQGEAGDVELLEAAGVPEFPTVKPHFETHANPLTANFESVGGETYFTHYEIQTVREWQAPDGSRAFEVCTDQDQCEDDAEGAAGPVLFGIYGHLNMGGVEHLCDRATLAEARETVARMGITI